MTEATTNDPLRERVERLLIRHEETRRIVDLLQQKVASLTTERDSAQARLHAASLRIDALLQRLPEPPMPEIIYEAN